VILTETHILSEDDQTHFEKKMGGEKMWSFGHSRGREGKCGVTIMVKRKIFKTGGEGVRIETDTEGRWVIVTIEGVLEEELVVCGMYAPTEAKEREVWMGKVEERMKKKKGYIVMGGDLNFVMDTRWDKTGDRANPKTE
jgi:exonuclease III